MQWQCCQNLPIPGTVQGQAGQDLEQPGLVKGVPAHGTAE